MLRKFKSVLFFFYYFAIAHGECAVGHFCECIVVGDHYECLVELIAQLQEEVVECLCVCAV